MEPHAPSTLIPFLSIAVRMGLLTDPPCVLGDGSISSIARVHIPTDMTLPHFEWTTNKFAFKDALSRQSVCPIHANVLFPTCAFFHFLRKTIL